MPKTMIAVTRWAVTAALAVGLYVYLQQGFLVPAVIYGFGWGILAFTVFTIIAVRQE